MENKDAKTDYQKFVSVGNQNWEIVEITIGIFFFFPCLSFVFTIFQTWNFQVPPEKSHPHLKCQFSPKILIWAKSLLYTCYEKWHRFPPPHYPVGEGDANYAHHFDQKKILWIFMIFYFLEYTLVCNLWGVCQ